MSSGCCFVVASSSIFDKTTTPTILLYSTTITLCGHHHIFSLWRLISYRITLDRDLAISRAGRMRSLALRVWLVFGWQEKGAGARYNQEPAPRSTTQIIRTQRKNGIPKAYVLAFLKTATNNSTAKGKRHPRRRPPCAKKYQLHSTEKDSSPRAYIQDANVSSSTTSAAL